MNNIRKVIELVYLNELVVDVGNFSDLCGQLVDFALEDASFVDK